MTDFAAPRKSLGQNFLQDPNIIRKIVASLNVQSADLVVEIGPGRGALTEHLLDLGADLHLIEFDRDLCAYWRERAKSKSNLVVHEADVLAFDFSQLVDPNRPIKVIGNLPYNISSPILFSLLEIAPYVHSQVVMLQKEVVERMSSPPGSKQFGRLSVMLQYRYQIENLFNVPPTAFYPPPKVDSAIARLTPHAELPVVADQEQDLQRLVKQAFSQRRKTVRNNLKGLLSSAQIEHAGIDPGKRAETLQVADFVALANLLTSQSEDITHDKSRD